ncbi:GntR family transcriptional regulator [Cellulosimicrobium sp. CUA-896]|uniref:GntR family transcriptional regulator n=1 Tax=Cellulosimicrobium sp. CUA-896 TaxID=1517881 RepID=UPI00095C82AC|nr:GntR family transcriptional regulator [Cellulosimicrobium sp. CUA-896]OLT53559.1 GntR family transcriptional regulator [Cellulosimicrobium sp. CUA-896]
MPVPTHAPATGRRLLRDDVYRRLRDAIIDGTFEPGEQLRDGELAAWLGVSRTPVREALLRLASSGLVVARPGRSTVVSELDPRALREARDVVAAMHRLAVGEAVPLLTDADLNAMSDAARRFAAAVEAGDVDAAVVADDALHGIPVEVAGNRAVADVLEQYTPLLRRAERLRFAAPDAQESIARHDELIRLCRARDAVGAAAVAAGSWSSLQPGAGRSAEPLA